MQRHRGEETEGCEEVRFKAKEARERGLLSSPTTELKKGGIDPLKEGAGFWDALPAWVAPPLVPAERGRWPFKVLGAGRRQCRAPAGLRSHVPPVVSERVHVSVCRWQRQARGSHPHLPGPQQP